MAYENYTIKQFENAMFKDDRSVMTEDVYDEVYNEYVDTAKLYEEEEFNRVSRIKYLNNRINTISLGIRLQRGFIDNFDVPYLEGFKVFKDNGHIIVWKNKDHFLETLRRIEVKEKKYISEVENAIKLLYEFRKKKNTTEQPVKIKRESFIKTINTLGKIGYKIDKFSNSVEDLALMIRQQKDDSK